MNEDIGICITFIANVFLVFGIFLFSKFVWTEHRNPNAFTHRYMALSYDVLFYLMCSRILTSICTYYLLLWQLFHFEHLIIITLDAIILVVKLIIDIYIYCPGSYIHKGQEFRDIESHGYSPWVLCDSQWEKLAKIQYILQAFAWFDKKRSLCVKLMAALSNPLSIAMHTYALAFIFCAISNSQFIPMHSLLSLLILSTSNEITKRYVYKQRIVHLKLGIAANIDLHSSALHQHVDYTPVLLGYHIFLFSILIFFLLPSTIIGITIACVAVLNCLIMLALFARYILMKCFDERTFYLRHTIGRPSVYLLYYVVVSHAFITICTYYVRVWQLILFHPKALVFEILSFFVFMIKFVIDICIYFPGNLGRIRNMKHCGYSPWVICYDTDWKTDYYQQKAFGCYKNKLLPTKIILILFCPLSIQTNLCIFAFLSIYYKSNPSRIEWNNMLLLLLLAILCAINEVIKHGIYKKHIPFDKIQKKSLVLKLEKEESVALKARQEEQIMFLLIRRFGRQIAYLIWKRYVAENMQLLLGNSLAERVSVSIKQRFNENDKYWTTIKRVDRLLKLYFEYNWLDYDYYDSFLHFVDFKMQKKKKWKPIDLRRELGEGVEYKSYRHKYLEFNSDFPFFDESVKNTNEGKKIIFSILKICYHLSESIMLDQASDVGIFSCKDVDEFNYFLQSFIYLHKIHLTLKMYYRANGGSDRLNLNYRRDHYFLNGRKGTMESSFQWFTKFILSHHASLDNIFKKDVPSSNNELNLHQLAAHFQQAEVTEAEIFKILKIGHETKHFVDLSYNYEEMHWFAIDDDDDELNEFKTLASFGEILNIFHQHFDPQWSAMLKGMRIPDAFILFPELDSCLQNKKIFLSAKQWRYCRQIIKKIARHKEQICMMISMKMETETDMEYLRDVYFVHKAFVEETDKSIVYTTDDFYQLLGKNHVMEQLTPSFLSFYLNHYHWTLQMPPVYVMDDNLFEIQEYIISMTHLMNSMRGPSHQAEEENFNLFVIPHSVKRVVDDEECKYTFDDSILKWSKCKQDIEVEKGGKKPTLMTTLMSSYGVNGKYFNFVVDRRANDFDKIYLIATMDDKEQNDAFYSFYTSYLLSFHFIICHAPKDVVRCYLNYAINEQMRFFPQHFVDILPKLFKKPKYEKMEQYYTHYIRPIYHRNYRNSWDVDLFDQEFNEKYKELTGYDHVAVNYDRVRTKFVDDSHENIDMLESKGEKLEYEYHVDEMLGKCGHIAFLVKLLKSTQISKSASLINIDKYAQISSAFDHLVRCHHLFRSDKLISIQEYFISKCGYCMHGHDCPTLRRHIKQSSNGRLDSLFEYLQNFDERERIFENLFDPKQFNMLQNYFSFNEYDSEAVRDDLEDEKQSNILQAIDECKMDAICFDLIQKHFADDECLDIDELMSQLYGIIHIHLLHPNHDLYTLNDHNTNVAKNKKRSKKRKEKQFKYLFHSLKTKNKKDTSRLRQMMKESNLLNEQSIRKDVEHGSSSQIKQMIESLHSNDITFRHIRILLRPDFGAINFGQSVLCWLEYDQQSTFSSFQDEIVSNPASTINSKQCRWYEEECRSKQENASMNRERYRLKELIAMKIYCDTNAYQAALRRAFWDLPSSHAQSDDYAQMKRNFYRWALTLYQTFLYAAKPPIQQKNTNPTPVTLYHGLDQLLILKDDCPKYNGIVSTSTAENTACSFSKTTGLSWTIKGSYTNRFTFIKGIDMQWVSGHPDEQEFALFDQYIPIHRVRSYARTDEQRIDILMQQLKSFEKSIPSPRKFYSGIGFKYKQEWTQNIIFHRHLYDESPIHNMSVIDRLVHELHIDGLHKTLTQRDLNKIGNITRMGHQIQIEGRLMINKWNASIKRGGVIRIKCGSLIIPKDCAIIADACGDFADERGIGKDEKLRVFFYGSPDGSGQSATSIKRRGGIIEIIAEIVVNKGVISCCGDRGASGGSIKIRAKRMKNDGKIFAKGGGNGGDDGLIAIYCEERIKGTGHIQPLPHIAKKYRYTKKSEFTPIVSSISNVPDLTNLSLSAVQSTHSSSSTINNEDAVESPKGTIFATDTLMYGTLGPLRENEHTEKDDDDEKETEFPVDQLKMNKTRKSIKLTDASSFTLSLEGTMDDHLDIEDRFDSVEGTPNEWDKEWSTAYHYHSHMTLPYLPQD